MCGIRKVRGTMLACSFKIVRTTALSMLEDTSTKLATFLMHTTLHFSILRLEYLDNLDGGIPGEGSWATSIDLVLYIVYEIEGCSGVPQCLSLTSFDRKQHQWSYTLRSGVYELSQGYKY